MAAEIEIAGRKVGAGHPCFVIAEAGINHQGSIKTMLALTEVARAAWCDAIKTQKRTVDVVYSAAELAQERPGPWGATNGDLKRLLEFDAGQCGMILAHAEQLGLTWSASPWDMESVRVLGELGVPWVKVASASITDLELVNGCASLGVPVIMSTGMSTTAEIDAAVEAVKRVGAPLALLHTCSAYPSAIEDLHLSRIAWLRERYGEVTGYCVTPDTPVLTADLRWTPAGDLAVGQEIVGFDEKLDRHCKMRRATVTGTRLLRLPCYEIETDRGSIVASADHRFVSSRFFTRPPGQSKGGQWKSAWIPSSEIRTGDTIRHFVRPWRDECTSYDAGWLAGMFDGEGWVSGRRASVAQNPGPLLDRLEQMLRARGYAVKPRQASPGRRCRAMEIGGRRESMRFLGSIRPSRLLAKSHTLWEGVRAWSADSAAKVLSVRFVGEQEVCGLTTSTGTLITNGFMSHNSGHETGVLPSVEAVRLGASIVERHVTLDRTMWGSDQAASLEPTGLRILVRAIREWEGFDEATRADPWSAADAVCMAEIAEVIRKQARNRGVAETSRGVPGERRVLAVEEAVRKKLRRTG